MLALSSITSAARRLRRVLAGDLSARRGLRTAASSFRAASVWGALRSYRDIANALDNPNAVRAVGAANGRNPIPIVVPCHRVIGSDGSLTGFAGGLAAKKKLLQLEGAIEPEAPQTQTSLL